MSRENVAIVRQVYDAVARGDREAVLAAYDPAVEMRFTQSPLLPVMKQEIYRGHDGLRSLFQERPEAWGSIEDVCEEMIDAGGEHVVTRIRSQGRGRASGAEVELHHFGLWRFRDGKIVEVSWFESRDEALEAASGEAVAMSSEERDLEVLRGMYAKWSVGDFDSVEEFAEDVVWLPRDLLDSGEYRGLEELSGHWRGWLQTFSDDFRIEADEIIPCGENRYVVIQTFRGTGKASGVQTQGRALLMITMREGKIARMEGFWDVEQGLAAAGLGS